MKTKDNWPRITVVTPSFNQGKFLEETIQSILNQNYPNLEYFIVDGGSTDNSVDIIKKYENKIDWWVSEPDKGQSDAINKALSKATGAFVSWLNSDDMLLPGALRRVAEFISSHTKADVVMGAMLLGLVDGSVCSYYRPSRAPTWCMKRGAMDLLQPSTFIRRTDWLAIGGLRQDSHCRMDADMLHRLHSSGAHFYYISEPLSFFRDHSDRKGSERSKWQEVYEKERKIWREENQFQDIELILAREVRILQKIATGVYFNNYLKTKYYRNYKVEKLWQEQIK